MADRVFPDKRFEQYALASAVVSLIISLAAITAAGLYSLNLILSLGIPSAVGAFLATLLFLVHLTRGMRLRAVLLAPGMFIIFPASAVFMVWLLGVGGESKAAEFVSLVPGVLFAPAAYRWIERQYVSVR